MGRDGWRLYSGVCAVGFNSRARMGRDLAAGNHETARVVSIHAPAWARPPPVSGSEIIGFNSRARVGATGLHGSLSCRCFNSRPHRRDKQKRRAVLIAQVSIHAPAWGTTAVPQHRDKPPRVSIHAPAWGATVIATAGAGSASFQFTAPAWGATAGNTLLQKLSCFNSRPHGARPATMLLEHHLQRFNSRARMGRDVRNVCSPRRYGFQFTRPHGARLPGGAGRCRRFRFNSRARMGRD